MKKSRIILRIVIITLVCVCLLSCWRDISVNVPQRLEETGSRIEILAGSIYGHFVSAVEESVEEVKNWYDGLVSGND